MASEMYCLFIKILKGALVCWEIKAWFKTFTVAEASRFEKEEDYVRGWHLIQFFLAYSEKIDTLKALFYFPSPEN